MNLFHEILNALIAFAAVGDFLLSLWQEYKHQRMTKEENKK